MKKTHIKRALNEGQESLKGSSPLDVIIDWVQVTFKGLNIKDLLSLLDINIDETYFVSKGLFGYHFTYVYKEKIKFMTSQNKDMGIHLMLSGKACREWEEYVIGSWDKLFHVIHYTDSKVTRIDIAIDSFTTKYFTTTKVINAIRNKTVSSRALYAINTEKIYLQSKTIQGHTISFGNRASEVSVVFYDKLQERKQASYVVNDDIKVWQRCELRLRGDTANKCINEYQLDLKLVKGILTNYVNFKQLKGSTTIRKREHIKWWSDFIQDVQPIQLSTKAIQSSIQKKKDWFQLGVSKTLAMLYCSDIEDFNQKELITYISQGMKKFRTQDIDTINQYRIENGASVISHEDYKEINRMLKTTIDTNTFL